MPSVKKGSASRPWIPERVVQARVEDETEFDYNSHKWRKDRRMHLSENPLCVVCKASGIVAAATVSDHIQPVRQGGDPWDWSNRQGLCKTCHNQKSGREAHSRRSSRAGGV